MHFLLLFLASSVWAAIIPTPISRQSANLFVSEGLFQGGSASQANLEGIRFGTQPKKTERWVMDFSDTETRVVGDKAPVFQMRFVKGNSVGLNSKDQIQLAPPKFIFTFRGIAQNKVSSANLRRLLKKSSLVKEIIFYPAIEDGDMAVEWILKQNVVFEAHQPFQKEGRLVLDLRPAASR